MLLFNGLVRLPGIGARISPYAGAGVGASLPHTEVELTNGGHPRTYEYNYAGPATQALLGVEIRLARVSFFVEYKFTYARLQRAAVAGRWQLAAARHVAAGEALVCRRAAARRAHRDRACRASDRERPCRAHGSRPIATDAVSRGPFQPRHMAVHPGAGARYIGRVSCG